MTFCTWGSEIILIISLFTQINVPVLMVHFYGCLRNSHLLICNLAVYGLIFSRVQHSLQNPNMIFYLLPSFIVFLYCWYQKGCDCKYFQNFLPFLLKSSNPYLGSHCSQKEADNWTAPWLSKSPLLILSLFLLWLMNVGFQGNCQKENHRQAPKGITCANARDTTPRFNTWPNCCLNLLEI